MNDVMPVRAEDFEIWKKEVSWDSSLEEGSRFLSSPRRDQFGSTGCLHVGWVKRKEVGFWSRLGETSWDLRNVPCVCWRNCVSLSSCRKTLNSKRYIKVSYLNQFRVFSDSYVHMLLNIMKVLCMWISWSYFLTWICYKSRKILLEI